MYPFVFKRIHFTVVTLLLTLKKEVEIKTDNATESPFMYQWEYSRVINNTLVCVYFSVHSCLLEYR